MYWKEVRQLVDPGGARDSTSPGSVTPVLSAEAVVPVTSGKHEDKPAVVTGSPGHGPECVDLDWDSSSGDDGVHHVPSSSHQRLPTPWISGSSPPPPLEQQNTDNTTSQLAARYPVAVRLRRGPLLCPLSPCGLLFAAPC